MASFSLVAYEGCSTSESEGDEVENQVEEKPSTTSPSVNSKLTESRVQSSLENLQKAFSLRFEELPTPKNEIDNLSGVVISPEEEIGPIPPKKIYGDEEAPPTPSTVTARIGVGSDGRTEVTATRGAKGVMRISIPSLKEFENEEEESSQKKKFASDSQKKGSGLFAILPEPKGGGINLSTSAGKTEQRSSTIPSTFLKQKSSTSLLIPHTVQQSLSGKRPAEVPLNEKLAKVRAKYLKQETNFKFISKPKGDKVHKTRDNDTDSEDSSDIESESAKSSDFFSLDEKSNPVDISSINLDYYRVSSSHELENNELDTLGSTSMDFDEPHQETLPSPSFSDVIAEQQEDLMKYIQPDRRHKGKGRQPPINIIDVNADDLRPASTDWLKTITDKSIIPPRKANLPGGMMKRKHQITYLAAEAKAREEELQNQWAHNRHSRRQTQSKYGF